MARKDAVKLVGLLCMTITLAGFAPRATADDDDPSSRVARLSYAQGSVSFQPAGTNDWVTAGLNRPVTTGDKLWSDHDGRIEMQLDGSLIRLSSDTGFSFLNLSDNATQIQLTTGTVLVRVRRLDDNEIYEIDTPNLAFSVLRPGLYRITVNEAVDSTAIRIRSGEGEVTGGGAAYTVHANEYDTFSGTDELRANSKNYANNEDSSIAGLPIATDAGKTRTLHATFPLTSWATRTWMITAPGAKLAITATCGFRGLPSGIGLLITTGIGTISSLGAIRG